MPGADRRRLDDLGRPLTKERWHEERLIRGGGTDEFTARGFRHIGTTFTIDVREARQSATAIASPPSWAVPRAGRQVMEPNQVDVFAAAMARDSEQVIDARES